MQLPIYQVDAFSDKVFGGKDPYQLPPLGDKPLYHTKPSNNIGEQGHQVYRSFEKVVKRTINQRVHGTDDEQVLHSEIYFSASALMTLQKKTGRHCCLCNHQTFQTCLTLTMR